MWLSTALPAKGKEKDENQKFLMRGSRYPVFRSITDPPPPPPPPSTPQPPNKHNHLSRPDQLKRSASSRLMPPPLTVRPALRRSKTSGDVMTDQDFESFLNDFYALYLY